MKILSYYHKLLHVLISSILKISKKTPYKVYTQIFATLRHDKFLSSETKCFGWTDYWELNPEICIHFDAWKNGQCQSVWREKGCSSGRNIVSGVTE
jgi:hypothetical protein